MMKKLLILLGLFAALFILVPYQLLYLLHRDDVVLLEPYMSIHMDTIFGQRIDLPFDHVYGHGSGVLIGSEGYILTAGHMVNNSRLMHVKTHSGREYKATFVGRYSKGDLALLKIVNTKDEGFNGVNCLGWKVMIGDQVFHIGNPMNISWIFTEGRVSQMTGRYTLSTTVVNPGSSGGALYNRYGFLIGICSALQTPSIFPAFAGHSIFVDVDGIKDFLAGWNV